MVLAILVAIGKTGAKGLLYAGDVERLRKSNCEEAFCLVDEKPPVALRLGQERFSSFGTATGWLAHQTFGTTQQLLKTGSIAQLEEERQSTRITSRNSCASRMP